MIKRLAFSLAVLLAAAYLADLALLRFRHNPTAVVTIHPYTAVPRNDKREELIFDDPHDETCANTLFPHQAMSPCWYLKSHTQRRKAL